MLTVLRVLRVLGFMFSPKALDPKPSILNHKH